MSLAVMAHNLARVAGALSSAESGRASVATLRHTLFTIPDEKEWTVIFNKVTAQWGAFNYNPVFDALRVKIIPQTAEIQERFGITFEITGSKTTNIVLRWDRSRVVFKVENAA